jgi:hypothetical protein
MSPRLDPAQCLEPIPLKPLRPTREDRLRVRVLPEETKRWQAIAKAHGMPLSTWLRGLADESASIGRNPDEWKRELSRFLRDLNSGVGANLNQIAKHLNAQKKAGNPVDVLACAETLKAIAQDIAVIRRQAEALLGVSVGRPQRNRQRFPRKRTP